MSNVLTEQLVVEFSPLKRELRQTLQQLQSAEQTREVQKAIAKLERAIDDFSDLCGLSMTIPISPR